MPETIKSPFDNFELTAHRVQPKGARKGGVVVIQEIFGISDHIKQICDFYAEQGYEALAPSLYDRIEKGFSATMDDAGLQKAFGAMQATSSDQAAGDMQAAIDALGAGPIYITGFCYGGAMTFLASARCKGLAAASGFYGAQIPTLLSEKPKVPLILHFGTQDSYLPMEGVELVKKTYPDIPVYLYETGHGFCRKGSDDYNAAACDTALQRTLDWFAKHR